MVGDVGDSSIHRTVQSYTTTHLYVFVFVRTRALALVCIPSSQCSSFLSLSKYLYREQRLYYTSSPFSQHASSSSSWSAFSIKKLKQSCFHAKKRGMMAMRRTCFAACCSFSCPWLLPPPRCAPACCCLRRAAPLHSFVPVSQSVTLSKMHCIQTTIGLAFNGHTHAACSASTQIIP